MSDFLLGVASPEFWRDCGFALSATGVIGIVAVIIFPDDKRRLQKGLALAFVALSSRSEVLSARGAEAHGRHRRA